MAGLDLTGTRVDGELRLISASWLPTWADEARLVLINTRVGAVQDGPGGWPQELDLDGFAYERFGGFGTDPETAVGVRGSRWFVEWLARDEPYSPQPYAQSVAACASHPPAPRAEGPYVAPGFDAFEGRVVGAGHCVDFVKAAAGVPLTAAWSRGAEVRGNPHIVPGTAIATFEDDGTYTSRTGNHAAIYLYQDQRGIWVYDQWRGRPVGLRLIRFEGGAGSGRGSKSNDGRRFAVIG